MPRIRCHYTDCVFLDDGYCSAAQVELDPDTGCATYSPTAEALPEEDWDQKEGMEEWGEEFEDEEEDWLEEDEDEI